MKTSIKHKYRVVEEQITMHEIIKEYDDGGVAYVAEKKTRWDLGEKFDPVGNRWYDTWEEAHAQAVAFLKSEITNQEEELAAAKVVLERAENVTEHDWKMYLRDFKNGYISSDFTRREK